ncbi:MAG: sigma-70 family RNA polymerase sigma factor [bacterium]
MSVPEAQRLTPSDEYALVARIRAGDEQAFAAVYSTHHAALWRFAFGYVRARAVAEEIVQDVFMALWRDRASWEISTSVRAWLYGATRNHALNHLRHERVVARHTDAAMHADTVAHDAAVDDAQTRYSMGAPPPDSHMLVEAHDLDDAVDNALAELPVRRRVAMTLRWKHDLSASEIAHVLGTTPEAVRVHLTRARHDLAALLARIRE